MMNSVNLNNIYKNQNISFKKNYDVILKEPDSLNGNLDSENRSKLMDLLYGYTQIQSMLSKKTSAGVMSLISEHRGFSTADGITLKNIGTKCENISIEPKTPRGYDSYTKLLVKDKNGKIKEGYLIKDGSMIVKNYNLEEPNKIPENPKFYSVSEIETFDLNNRLSELFDKIDEPLFDVRKFVIKRKDDNLKIADGKIDNYTQSLLSSIDEINTSLNEISSPIENASLTRIKKEYPDYCLRVGQAAHMFKNIGENNEKIVFSKNDVIYQGEMYKLLVYNEDDSLKTGYLVKDGKIVSNYNPQKPNAYPEKLAFVNAGEIVDIHYNEELNGYLNAYKEKLTAFKDLVVLRKRVPFGNLDEKNKQSMEKITDLYHKTESVLSNFSIASIPRLKAEYADYDHDTGKRGFTLKNIGDGKKTINIAQKKSPNGDVVFRITVLNSDGSDKQYITIKNSIHIANNYNITSKEAQEKLDIINDLKDIEAKMEDFNKFMVNRFESSRRKNPKTKRAKAVKAKMLKPEQRKELVSDFKNAILQTSGGLPAFDDAMAKIREKFADFIKNKSADE